MSSYDKIVKLACKPKAAAPKSKYIEPIIAATWSEDGAVSDVCRALAPRFREPNAVVVFKALIVLHTMIRNGATENVLAYLSTTEVLRLKNVSASNWEGYDAPRNLQTYATYLDVRIRAYKDLKHDAIRVQAESNRDLRSSQGFEDDAYQSPKPQPKAPSRSKTIMGRKLRVMTVEKGLLRETRAVHRMIDALLDCKLYHDNLEDELIIISLRMLVKDLLILFQAGNEGVINVLEHYFEMSHVDAEEALTLYRKFCKQTEQVVEYLGIARKLQNLLSVSIPNLRHAPVSLAGALQDYLDDPNFEQNRIEYKLNKDSADRNRKGEKSSKTATKSETPPVPSLSASSSTPSNGSANGQPVKKEVQDFFNAIEGEQTPIFNGQPSPNINISQFQQPQPTGAPNPFVQRQMFTGQPFMQQQATGFPMAQPMGLAPNPFGSMQSLQPQATGHRPFSSFIPSQPTGAFPSQSLQASPTGFLQPQATGSNPFRQSMLLPMSTGMPMGGSAMNAYNNMQNQNGSPFPTASNSAGPMMGTFTNMTSPSANISNVPQPVLDVPARPSSTPLTSISSPPTNNSPPAAQPVKKHITGTKNPFGPVVEAPPPVPKQPTMFELMSGMNNMNVGSTQQSPITQPALSPQQPGAGQASAPSTQQGHFGFTSSALSPGATDISSIASSFTFDKSKEEGSKSSGPGSFLPSSGSLPPSLPDFSKFSSPLSSQTTSTTLSGFSDSLFSSVSSQPTGATTTSSPSISVTPITSQPTGMSGLKPFKPSSSFGAQLLDSLPPIPGSAPTTPAATGNTSAHPPFSTSMSPPLPTGSAPPAASTLSGQALQSTGLPTSTLGVGLRPQMTGGAANPFRASMMGLSNAPPLPTGANSIPNGSNSTASFGAFGGGLTGMPTGAFSGNAFSQGTGGFQSYPQQQQQQQQNNGGSLI